MAPQMSQVEEHHEELKTFIEKFEDQFDVEVDSTGHEMAASQNGGIHSEEYWVKGLIESPADGLDFKVGGWFEMDTRGDGEPTVSCHFAVKMNNEKIGEDHQAIKSRFHHDKEKWGELRWGSM